MNNNKMIKIIGLLFISLIGIGLIVHAINNIDETPITTPDKQVGECKKEDAYCIFEYNDKEYYVLNKGYQKEHDIQFFKVKDLQKEDEYNVYNYDKYESFCKKYNINQKFNNKDSNYLIYVYYDDYNKITAAVLGDVEIKNNKAHLYIWDMSNKFGGVKAFDGNTSGYAIIIPTTEKPTQYEVIPLYHRTDYNDLADFDPLEGYKYTKDDNIVLANNMIVETNNIELNRIIKNSIIALSKEHTIRVETQFNDEFNSSLNSYLDLVNSVFKVQSGKQALHYYAFADDMVMHYARFSLYDSGYEKDKIYENREKMFYTIFSVFGNNFLEEKNYKVNITEDGENYIIETKRDEYNDATYYIFKDTYLINKIVAGTRTNYFSYTNDNITLPSDINVEGLPISVDKPILYLYPEKEMDIKVSLKDSDLIVSYPKYENVWDVKAYPNGNIYDKKTKKNYYSLYWEANIKETASNDEGFVVSKEDSIKFLEEKLKLLGLNDRETNEFIIYWLPILEKNEYNLIHFLTEEEVERIVPLELSVKPDTMIRVYIQITPLNEYKEVKEQKLLSKERKGFTSVDWGGILIK